jgi:hypothetical protein
MHNYYMHSFYVKLYFAPATHASEEDGSEEDGSEGDGDEIRLAGTARAFSAGFGIGQNRYEAPSTTEWRARPILPPPSNAIYATHQECFRALGERCDGALGELAGRSDFSCSTILSTIRLHCIAILELLQDHRPQLRDAACTQSKNHVALAGCGRRRGHGVAE